MAIHKATRTGIKPLIGAYGESGTGKTMSALLLARGLVGPNGKIVFLDTESGRGSLYADVIPGGYDVLDIKEPFSPQSYIAAIREAEEAKADCIIIDSMTHEWSGISGVLDMAVAEEERGMKGLGVWKRPKMEHAKMMAKLLQSTCPIIACVRAKYKSRQVKENGKTSIVKDEVTTPEQAEDFIYELMAHFEVLPDHSIRLSKCSHPDLRDCFPVGKPITVGTGEKIAAWCKTPSGGTKPLPTVDPKKGPMEVPKDYAGDSPSTAAKIKALKRKLLDMTRHISLVEKKDDKDADKWAAGLKFLNQWLIDEGVMTERETLAELGLDRMTEVVASVQKKVEAK